MLPLNQRQRIARQVQYTRQCSSKNCEWGESWFRWKCCCFIGGCKPGTYAGKPTTTSVEQKGDMYIVSNDTNENNGRTFISDGEEW